jgi:hypothetical protein
VEPPHGIQALTRVLHAVRGPLHSVLALAPDVALTRELCRDPGSRAALLRYVAGNGFLRPAPDVFWRVDRNLDDYAERLGVNLHTFVPSFVSSRPGVATILELGSGSGRVAEELTSMLEDRVLPVSINDAIYFPLRPCIQTLLRPDMPGLTLTADEMQLAVDWIYKVLSLRLGTTSDDTLQYDAETIASLRMDANSLLRIILKLGEKLAVADVVPSEVGVQPLNDGTQRYPEKIHRDALPRSIRSFLEVLASTPHACLADIANTDVYQHLSIYPAGMMLEDFAAIRFIPTQSLALALSVRGTTYLSDTRPHTTSYSSVLVEVVRTLEHGGICLEDGVRENFGKRYRLPELVSVARQAQRLFGDVGMYVVCGPGVPGDDHNPHAAVRAAVISKPSDSVALLRLHLRRGYQLRSLDDVIGDETYLRSLDPVGRTWAEVQAALNGD